MPRKRLIRSNEFPYHVTTRSNNKEWFYIPLEDVWTSFEQLLREGEKKFQIEAHAYVLMSNHYHLCLRTPRANIDEFMQFFNKKLGEAISRQAQRINRIFGAPYKWNLIYSGPYFLNVVRYIYQNPLRANLCADCTAYPFSNFRASEYQHLEEWINQPLRRQEVLATTKKLRRFEIRE